jgi:hypothetical protein
VVAARRGVVQSVVAGSYMLQYTWRDGTKELYNLVTDPKQQTNLHDPVDPATLAMWDLLLPQMEAAQTLLPSDVPYEPGP